MAGLGEGVVTPLAVDGDAEEVGVVALELRQNLVVERHLVSAHRAPVGRVEGQDDRLGSQLVQRERLVGRGVEGAIGGGFASRQGPFGWESQACRPICWLALRAVGPGIHRRASVMRTRAAWPA